MKRPRKRQALGELDPNVRYNRLELETTEERDTRRKAEAEEKRVRRQQMTLRRGDIPTGSNRPCVYMLLGKLFCI